MSPTRVTRPEHGQLAFLAHTGALAWRPFGLVDERIGDCARFDIGVLAGRRALRSHPCRDKTEQELNTPMWIAGDRRASISAKTLPIPYFSCSGGCPGIGHKQCAGGHRLACDEL
jgi:hypothetical protein